MNLTPYDTGEVAEPKIWKTLGDRDRYGMIEFEDDAGTTLLTARMIRDEETGYYVLQLDKWDENITVEVIQ